MRCQRHEEEGMSLYDQSIYPLLDVTSTCETRQSSYPIPRVFGAISSSQQLHQRKRMSPLSNLGREDRRRKEQEQLQSFLAGKDQHEEEEPEEDSDDDKEEEGILTFPSISSESDFCASNRLSFKFDTSLVQPDTFQASIQTRGKTRDGTRAVSFASAASTITTSPPGASDSSQINYSHETETAGTTTATGFNSLSSSPSSPGK